MARDRSWIVGAAEDCDLVVDLPTVSGRHCRLERRGDRYTVADLGSTNGTFVNGRAIDRPTAVSPRDAVTLGRSIPMPWPADEDDDPTGDEGGRAPIRIGRDPDNDVVLDGAMVSGRHARIVFGGGGAVIEDLGSSNGTSLNAPDRRIARAPLSPSDVVYFGSMAVPASRLLGHRPSPGGVAEGPDLPRLLLTRAEQVLGRDPGCDRVIDAPMVSDRHARIWRSGGAIYLEDLGSSNGTSVNGTRIGRRPVAVRPGDVIALGSYAFAFSAEGALKRRSYRGRVAVEARGVGVDAGGSTLIDDVSLTIYPSELVGLMGPSGAGKSTLVRAMVGYRRPDRGDVLLDGVDLYAHDDAFRGEVGYVPQDDIVHRGLTVGQALRYAGRLRLPAEVGAEEVERRVRTVLDQLDLAGAEQVPIGPPSGGGVSGGQRKRVNLAMELLTDPSVLVLDEPTSGLSSEDALLVMRLLRRLADAGKTILVTIHQPGLDAFRLLDHLAVIARDTEPPGPGRLAYFGPAYPGALAFFDPVAKPGAVPSADEVLRALAREPASAWAERFSRSEIHREYVERRAGTVPEGIERPEPSPRRRGLGLWQWGPLVRRNLAIKARDLGNSAALLLQAPAIAALIVLVFGRRAAAEPTATTWPEVAKLVSTTVFVLGLSAIWFGCSNAIREVVGEWPAYRRERMVNLRLLPYIASKFAVLGAIGLVQCLVLLAIVHAGSGLAGPVVPMFGILAMAALVGVAIGLAISAASRTTELAIALVPLVILPLLLLGGSLQPRHDLPTPIRQASDLLPSRWAFEGLLTLEAERRPTWKPPIPPALAGPADGEAPAIRDMAEHSFPSRTERMGPRAAAIALGAMLLGLAGLVAAILRGRDLH